MADDPVTFSGVEEFNLQAGLKMVTGLMTGGDDYDADPGQLADFSTYVQTIKAGPFFGGVTAAADALVYPTYVNDDYTDADGGAVVYTWDTANDGDAQNARAFSNVADTTDMSGYQWRFCLIGTEVTRT
jgi:hypothetical protein